MRLIDLPHGRELVDFHALSTWMEGEGLDRGPVTSIQQLTGGSQNVLIRFRKGGRDFVLRRPPLHTELNGSETMRREARLLAALGGTDVPHARLIAACEEEGVLGAAFYLMEPVGGFNAAVEMPALHASSPAHRRAMGLDLIKALSKLGTVVPETVGLTGFGRPAGFLERQLAARRKQLEGYARYPNWPGIGELDGIDRIAEWLERNRPAPGPPGIVHGDFHLKNVMFDRAGPTVAAIVDWEMATLGDPLVDLGWLLATWRDPDEPEDVSIIRVSPWSGFPAAQDLINLYGQWTARDTTPAQYYFVFACYKLATVLEGSYARSLEGLTGRETGERLHDNAIRLIRRALAKLSSL